MGAERAPIPHLIESYLQSRGLELAANSLAAYRDDIDGFVADLAPMDPRDASPSDLSAWLERHTRDAKDPDDPRPWSRSSAQRRLAAVRGWYAWMLEEGHCVKNPAARLKVRVPTRRAPVRFTESELGAFFAAGKHAVAEAGTPLQFHTRTRVYAICVLAYVLALRIEEIIGAERRGLDRTTTPWRLTLVRKGGKLRTYLIPDGTEVHGALSVALRDTSSTEPYLFTNPRTEKRFTRRVVLRHMQDWATAAGWEADRLEHWSPHALRHTRAYHLVAGGGSVQDVQDLLDHANLATTTLYVQHDQRGGDRLLSEEVRRPLPRDDHDREHDAS